MEDKGKFLIIKSISDDFERFYNNHMEQAGIDVWNCYIDDNKKYSLNPMIKLLQICFKMVRNKWIWKMQKYKNIIIFDNYSLIPWIFLFKRHNTRIILWKWNIATPIEVERIKIMQRFCEIWTFDPKDADRYNWHLNSPFCFCSPIEANTCEENKEEKKSVFFVGRDKERYIFIQKMYNMLKQHGLYCDFWFVGDKDRQYDAEDADWVKDEDLPYEQVLEHIIKCDAVLDIAKEGQIGFTLRVLESIFYQKKLITNNKDIFNTDVYSENNIFIIDHDDWNDLEDFMKKPYQALPKEILDAYTFDNWLNNFGIVLD